MIVLLKRPPQPMKVLILFDHFVPMTGKLTIDTLRARVDRQYRSLLTFRSLLQARSCLFAHAVQMTNRCSHRSNPFVAEGRCRRGRDGLAAFKWAGVWPGWKCAASSQSSK